MSGAYTSHVDGFARERLPPPRLWPEFRFDLPELQYPERINCGVVLIDDAVAEGHGERIALYSEKEHWTYAQLLERANLVIRRKRDATVAVCSRETRHLARNARFARDAIDRATVRRESRLVELARTLRAHEPQRTLERGFALVMDRSETPVTSASRAKAAGQIRVRFADDAVEARVEDD